jgi:hypothetical protein
MRMHIQSTIPAAVIDTAVAIAKIAISMLRPSNISDITAEFIASNVSVVLMARGDMVEPKVTILWFSGGNEAWEKEEKFMC